MKRLFFALAAGLIAAAVVHAHALYVVADGDQLTVVFSDDLSPDKRVKEESWKKIDGLKLTARHNDGKVEPVKTVKGEACLTAACPAGTQVIFGQVDYGVSKHGEKPKFMTFHVKAAVNGATGDAAKLGDKCPLEVVPVVADGKVKFQVLAAGKPVAKLEASVMVPGEKEKAKTTTDEGGFTQPFDAKGKYGVTVRQSEPKGGEAGGEKYDETTTVATLVCEVK